MAEEGHSHISEKLIRLLDRLSEICKREFSGLNAYQFSWKAVPDKWSVSECLQHSVLIANDFISRVDKISFKECQSKGHRKPYNSGRLGSLLIDRVSIREDNSIRKIRKCALKLRPDANPEITGIIILEKFLERSEKLKQILEKSKSIDLISNKLNLFSLPFFKIRLGDFMLYTVAHIERHIVQAQKVLLEENFPKPGFSVTVPSW
jgi:hypothetical protein